MKIRFGYVANALSLWNASPSKTLTFTRYKQLDKAARESKLREVTKQNLMNTMRALHYNIGHDIKLYRFSSSLVPLATHPEVLWDFRTPFKEDFKQIGELVKANKLRVSFHPNQFTLFTSDRPHVTRNAITDMTYHYHMLEAMGLESEAIINLHVGGAYGDKSAAIERFRRNSKKLPKEIRSRMTLENDDKTYTADETLTLCQKEGIPLLYDFHHDRANPGELPLNDLLPPIFDTWKSIGLKPKVHLSSPKAEIAFRHHADFVDVDFILPFLKEARKLNIDFDIMIEAKRKDQALLQLMGELEKIRGFKRVGGAEIEM